MENRQALGYILLACNDIRLDKEVVRKFKRAMYFQFDLKTEAEAEELGHEWYNNLEDKY
ncbi:hypothetical protein [Bacillus sp. C28GYM-DRY-1]|uniref:hypothetical protein n=1 Tax=Bacillus sp. C28GYM-DRY-1 TaxID=3062686 RepID=UPI002674930C|nr:hypothetical protein [Bacillus sp. C28GYM-DRY-1]MDO3663051.1 hypothetical protein [Bacillus sp. C28GYM-DRY-1]